MKHVVLLVGGPSAEREISLLSAKDIEIVLTEIGYRVTVIDPSQNSLLDALHLLKPDLVYNAMHGTYGEDGLVQSLLELARVPYTHSGVLSSAISMNKIMAKKLVSACGINVPRSFEMDASECFKLIQAEKALPISGAVVIKPIAQGSTLGIFLMRNEEDREYIIKKSKEWNFGKNLLIEEYINGTELTVAVLHGKPLGVLELAVADGDLLDYNAKYFSEKVEYIIPAKVPTEIYERAMEYSASVHRELMCKTISRIDLRFDKDEYSADPEKGLYFLEINTHPGMLLGHSFVPKIAESVGISFKNIIKSIVEDASCEYTDILNIAKL